MKWSEMSERERDALVAEKVMGWRYSTLEEYAWFRPSTLLADAWRVVEKFDWKTVACGLANQWYAEVRNVQEGQTIDDALQFYSFGDTAQEAICKAALLACGVEIEQ